MEDDTRSYRCPECHSLLIDHFPGGEQEAILPGHVLLCYVCATVNKVEQDHSLSPMREAQICEALADQGDVFIKLQLVRMNIRRRLRKN